MMRDDGFDTPVVWSDQNFHTHFYNTKNPDFTRKKQIKQTHVRFGTIIRPGFI